MKYKEHYPFLGSWLLVFLAILMVTQIMDKAQLHLLINSYHTPELDFIFKYLTYLGDGFAVVALSIVFLFYARKKLWALGFAFTASTILSQGLKHIWKAPRPLHYFTDIYPAEFYRVPGVTLHEWFSFPSGHTTTVFMMAGIIAFSISELSWPKSIGLLVIAWLVSFSRVYLSQHFMEDIAFGSAVGLVSAIVGLWLASLLKSSHNHLPYIKL